MISKIILRPDHKHKTVDEGKSGNKLDMQKYWLLFINKQTTFRKAICIIAIMVPSNNEIGD